MFLHFNNKLTNSDSIEWIDYSNLVKHNYIIIHYINLLTEKVNSAEAYNVIMELAPSALEGKQAAYHRHAWMIHNLIGHPLMQICAMVNLTKLGIKIHDATVPNPITK